MSSRVNNRQNSPNAVVSWLTDHPILMGVLVPALTVMFGLQVLRVLVPGLTWILGDRFDLGATYLGGVALLVFMSAFLAGGLRRLLGESRSIIITAGGLGLLRLVMQVWWGEPLVNLVMAMIGTALFIIFLPLNLNASINRGDSDTSYFIVGLLTGLALDTILHGALLTYDSVWQPVWPMMLLTGVLVLLQWLLLVGRAPPSEWETGVFFKPGKKTWDWLAIGPFLFLQLVVLHNVARLAVLTGWSLHLVTIWILVAQVVGLAIVVWIIRERRFLWLISLIFGVLLVVVSLFPYPESGWLAALALLTGQISASILIAVIIGGYAAGSKSHWSAATAANGIGMVMLVILLLGYYVVYQIKLPYDNTVLEVVAAVIIAVCGLIAAVKTRKRAVVNRRLWLVPVLLVFLLVPSLSGAITWHEPETEAGDGFPVRVMTYNLHNGFNPEGYLGMEALASVIEESQPDIVVLQEIARGWVISGRLDMLTWLSQRLDMPYVSGPTADPLWGNAILSRYPILEYENLPLPPRDLFILRGFTAALIDIGNGEKLLVMATHLHHIEEDSGIRQQQSPVILDFWDGADNTIILGDFNAEPDSMEIKMLQETGLVDAAARVGSSPANTFDSVSRYQRIDYIWVSPDLDIEEVFVPRTTASDHLPVIAVIGR